MSPLNVVGSKFSVISTNCAAVVVYNVYDHQ